MRSCCGKSGYSCCCTTGFIVDSDTISSVSFVDGPQLLRAPPTTLAHNAVEGEWREWVNIIFLRVLSLLSLPFAWMLSCSTE